MATIGEQGILGARQRPGRTEDMAFDAGCQPGGLSCLGSRAKEARPLATQAAGARPSGCVGYLSAL